MASTKTVILPPARTGSTDTTAPPGNPDGASHPRPTPHVSSYRRITATAGRRGQSIMGATMVAKLLRARLSLLFTVPRLHPVMSAISS
jgi:hypothetical protein